MKYELLMNLTEEYGGILKTADILKAGVSKTYFLDYVRANHFEKLANGIYLSTDAWRDELYILQLRFPGLIYSHNVSLYLFDLNDREPTKYTATVRRGYNAKKPRELGVTVYTVKRELYEMGVTTTVTTMGHEVKLYSPERTICDILRPNANVEMQDRQTALKEYVSRKDRDIPMLMEYAKNLKVDKELKKYLEVLL